MIHLIIFDRIQINWRATHVASILKQCILHESKFQELMINLKDFKIKTTFLTHFWTRELNALITKHLNQNGLYFVDAQGSLWKLKQGGIPRQVHDFFLFYLFVFGDVRVRLGVGNLLYGGYNFALYFLYVMIVLLLIGNRLKRRKGKVHFISNTSP